MADWRDRAACVGVDPELWHPEKGHPGAAEQTRQAMQICARCPVQRPCAEFAGDGQVMGVWAGRRISYQHIKSTYISPIGEAPRRYANVQPCGTYAASQRHIHRGEPQCAACQEARNEHHRNKYRERNRDGRAS